MKVKNIIPGFWNFYYTFSISLQLTKCLRQASVATTKEQILVSVSTWRKFLHVPKSKQGLLGRHNVREDCPHCTLWVCMCWFLILLCTLYFQSLALFLSSGQTHHLLSFCLFTYLVLFHAVQLDTANIGLLLLLAVRRSPYCILARICGTCPPTHTQDSSINRSASVSTG